MKKVTVFCVLLLMASILFAGGSGESKGTDNGPVELSLWHYFSPPTDAFFVDRIDEFNKEYEGKIHVTPTFVPRTELLKQYTIGAVSKELPDLGIIDNPDHAAFSAMGIFEDISSYYDEWDGAAFLSDPILSCSYEGGLYGLPNSSNCIALFYDVDAFEAAGLEPPETWSDLVKACEVLSDSSKGVYGLAMCAINNEEGTYQFIPFLESSGSSADLDSEGSVAALELLCSLIDNGYMSREVVNWTQADVEKQFAAGNAVMMLNGSWVMPAIRTDAPEKNWAVAKVPRADDGEFASCLGGENLVICKGADVEAAWTFLSWFCSRDNSLIYNRDVQKFSPRTDISGADLYPEDENMIAFSESMEYAKARGPHPRWGEYSAAIYTAMQEALTGQKAPGQALADAQAKVDKINAK